jgi:hypothetical protein
LGRRRESTSKRHGASRQFDRSNKKRDHKSNPHKWFKRHGGRPVIFVLTLKDVFILSVVAFLVVAWVAAFWAGRKR